MSPGDQAPIHQLVGFLAEYAPAELTRLQQRHSDGALRKPGRMLGTLSSSLRVRLDVASSGLRSMASQADDLAHRMGLQLRRSHKAEFVAQAMALLGSGSVLAAVLGDGSEQLKLVSAVFGLLGSTLALGVKFMRRDLAGVEQGLIAQHRELISAGGKALELSAKLEPHLVNGNNLGDSAALANLIDEANALAGHFYVLIKQVGTTVQLPGVSPREVAKR